MSRIYHDSRLRNKPVHDERVPGAWDPAACQRARGPKTPQSPRERWQCQEGNRYRDQKQKNYCITRCSICNQDQCGQGVILEGTLVDFSRHSITDAKGKKERWYILYLNPSRVHRRKFDSKGNEIEPNFSDTKKVNTGYLMSSFKVEAKGETDRLSTEELKHLIHKDELARISDKFLPKDTVAFWFPEAEIEKTELDIGEQLRVKTAGDGPFVFSLAKLDSGTVTKCNFAGDAQTGASWTDNIMANKSRNSDPAPESRSQGDGAEDDEWDD